MDTLAVNAAEKVKKLFQSFNEVYRTLWEPCLGGHFKTGHRGSLQNRPTGITLD